MKTEGMSQITEMVDSSGLPKSLKPISANSCVMVQIRLGHVGNHAPASGFTPSLALHHYLV